MHIHCLVHNEFETPGIIETWATHKNYGLTQSHTYRGDTLPKTSDFDFLIILGGPQSFLHLNDFPYLKNEIAFAQAAIQLQKPILGICLGAQLLGEALGAKTQKSPHKEIGEFPISLTEAGRQDPLLKNFPHEFNVLHWHSDMAGVSKDSTLLASSNGCPHQAFSYQNHVYGLQFHMEMTPEIVNYLIQFEEEGYSDTYVQNIAQLKTINLSAINEKMCQFLDNFIQLSY